MRKDRTKSETCAECGGPMSVVRGSLDHCSGNCAGVAKKKRDKASRAIRVAKRFAQGLCTICGKLPLLNGIQSCLVCKLVSVEKSSRPRQKDFPRLVRLVSPVDKESLLRLWDKHLGKCAITGVRLRLVGQDEDSVALDHVQPLRRGGHHIIQNLRFVAHRVNMMKGDMTDAEFDFVIGGLDGRSRLRDYIERRTMERDFGTVRPSLVDAMVKKACYGYEPTSPMPTAI